MLNQIACFKDTLDETTVYFIFVHLKEAVENWEFDLEWLRVQHLVKDSTGQNKLPDLQAILFLIGIQELGELRITYTKEEKQDLMHIAVCQLLSQDGYYEFIGKDEDNWPHYKLIKVLPKNSVEEQETLLKKKVIEYFKQPVLSHGTTINISK